jgi:hypothetical protein
MSRLTGQGNKPISVSISRHEPKLCFPVNALHVQEWFNLAAPKMENCCYCKKIIHKLPSASFFTSIVTNDM